MRIQKIQRDDADKVFVTVYNSVTTTLAPGSACCWDYTTDADGVTVILPTTALLKLLAGVVAPAAITGKKFGLIQVYGHNADALIDGTTDVAIGDPLTAVNASANFAKSVVPVGFGTGNVSHLSSKVTAAQAYTTAAAAAKKVFITAM